MDWLISRTKGDLMIWMIVIVLSLFSLLAVYSSTGTLAYRYHEGNTEYYLIKHFLLLMFGLILMYLAHLVDFKYYSRISQLLLFISIPLLILTLVLGLNINEARRWLTLPGVNLTFQPSDIAKLALIMFVARELSRKQNVIKSFKKTFLPLISAIIGICILIAPADLSTAAVLFASCLLLMFIGRVSFKHMAVMGLFGLLAFGMFLGISMLTDSESRLETWKNRVESFVSDDKGSYQNQQAKIAIASGGVFGKGPGNSTQRNFLPNPFSDFIYAIIIEEYGLIGGGFILSLYLLLLYRTIRIVTKSPKAFGALLAVGLSLSLVIQAMVNMAVTVHLLPVTGLTLPFVSMGGTSLLFTSLAIGIILSVSRHIEDLENKEENPAVNES